MNETLLLARRGPSGVLECPGMIGRAGHGNSCGTALPPGMNCPGVVEGAAQRAEWIVGMDPTAIPDRLLEERLPVWWGLIVSPAALGAAVDAGRAQTFYEI